MLRPCLCVLVFVTAFSSEASAQWTRTLRLNGLDNEAIIEDDENPDDDFIQIRSTNGTFETVRFRQPEAQLRVNLGGGHDNLLVRVPLTCSLHVFGASGNDVTRVESSVNGDIISDDTQGNNRLQLTRANVEGNIRLIDGPGGQALSMFYSSVKRNVYIESPDGGIGLTIDSSVIGVIEVVDDSVTPRVLQRIDGDVIVNNQGYGTDNLRINRASIRGDVYLDLGNGDFNGTVIQSGVESFSSIVGSGEVDLFMGELSSSTDINLLSVEGSMNLVAFSPFVNRTFLVRNGLGFDTLLISGLTRSGSDAEVTLDIDNGDGGSEITLDDRGAVPFSSRLERVVINNGDESDILNVSLDRDNSYLRSLEVSNGSGNSFVRIEDTGRYPGLADIGNVTIANGNQFDVLQVVGAELLGNLTAYNGNGGSDILLEDAVVHGNVDVRSDRERDYFTVVRSAFNGVADFKAGRGGDRFSVTESLFNGDFIADGGPGNDYLTLTADNVFNAISYIVGFERQFDQ